MRGYFLTPLPVVDRMVRQLFLEKPPTAESRLLDPGCGQGAFIDGVIRWCKAHGASVPQITGVELNSSLCKEARERFRQQRSVKIVQADFLKASKERFDYIIGNPPYVSIIGLTEEEKKRYRKNYLTARGRFDLYLLFYEQAVSQLDAGGRLVFITPEKFTYVAAAAPLRKLLAEKHVQRLDLISDETFGALVTYPTIATVNNVPAKKTEISLRTGEKNRITLPKDGSSWLALMQGQEAVVSDFTLEQLCLRISCGVATGADGIFVKRNNELTNSLHQYAYPTIAGRQLTPGSKKLKHTHSMLVPYWEEGELIKESELGALGKYLAQPILRRQLERRTCAQRKPWYAFHETPPLTDILRPKILCKDITERPYFWIDRAGKVVPGHTVYYLVPKDPRQLDAIVEYLNSKPALEWLEKACHRAHKGFLRIQSSVLKRLPIPEELTPGWMDRQLTFEPSTFESAQP